MHKEYFLLKLKCGLLSLPAEDRDEILAEYSAHFAFGEQQGRTEEEIARELGDPEELAVELLGTRDGGASERNEGGVDQPSGTYRPDMHRGLDMQGAGYGPHGMPHGTPPMPPPMYDMPHREGYGPPSRSAISIIGAIFSCFFAVPLLIGGWGLCVGLAGVTFALLIAPLLYPFKLAFGGAFYGAEMSIMFIILGIGIFMIQGIGMLFRAYGRLNRNYFRWVAGKERR